MLCFPTPIGCLVFEHYQDKLRSLSFAEDGHVCCSDIAECSQHKALAVELRLYFAGKLKIFSVSVFSDIKLSGFGYSVVQNLQLAPYGSTLTYGQLAQNAGFDVNHSRAVANICAANPLILVVPCHRVIRANGNIGGYNGGQWRKKWLLEHESR